jgi:glycosyltransferase involved in cell wall biosynthesis
MINSDTKPLVSIIIATFNRADFIGKCIDSVLGQSYKNIEIIIINDCSTDNTIDILELYTDKVKVVHNKKNMGIAYNSNLGFSVCKGDYICLLGDDDFWTNKDKVSIQLAEFQKNAQVGVSGTWWIEFDANSGNQIERKPVYPKHLKEKILSGGGLICGSAVMLSRLAWQNVNGFDEAKKRGTDSDIFRRIVLAGYDINIIESFMVSVDVTQGRTRMTDLVSGERIQSHIDSLLLTLSKHEVEYEQYPAAKATYFQKLGSLYEQKYNYTKSGYRMSVYYYINSLKIRPMRIQNIVRLTRVLLTVCKRYFSFK